MREVVGWWRLCDTEGREVAAMPDDWARGDGIGHAIIWGLNARDAMHLAEAVLVNDALQSRRVLGTNLPPQRYPDPGQLGLHADPR